MILSLEMFKFSLFYVARQLGLEKPPSRSRLCKGNEGRDLREGTVLLSRSVHGVKA